MGGALELEAGGAIRALELLDLGSQRLRIRLVIAEGPTSTLYSIDQGNSAIPVEETRVDGAQLTLSIPAIRASFAGRLNNGRIEGQFTQGGTLPLVFTRQQSAETAPPAEALTQARLGLTLAVRAVLANALGLLGVRAPESM